MITTSKKIVFFGNERLATGVFTKLFIVNSLIENNYEIVSIIINNKESKSRKKQILEIEEFAKKNNIPLLIPEKLSEIKSHLKKLNADVGILVAYGKIIPQEIIDIFPNGIINIHPSLLPKHRGPTPIESVIIDGSNQTGVSIMKLVSAMDAGPVYAQEKIELNGTESKQNLTDHLSKIGSQLLIKHLPKILNKSLKPKIQDKENVSYDKLITKLDGAIDWNLPAVSIEKQIRAYSGWPGARCEIYGKDLIIIKASVMIANGTPGEVIVLDNKLVVCTGENAINLEIVKPAGKNEMSAQAFLAGNKKNR